MYSCHRVVSMLLAVALLAALYAPLSASAQTHFVPRPAVSYLHGPFVALSVAARYTRRENSQVMTWTDYLTVRDRAVIQRLVHLMNRERKLPSPHIPCTGGAASETPAEPGPIWLAFVRAGGSKQHATYVDPCDGYFIHGVRLDDPSGAIWNALLPLLHGRG